MVLNNLGKIANQIAELVSKRNRKKKYNIFLAIMSPKKNEMIIDIGVSNEDYSNSVNYIEKEYPFSEKIIAVSNDSLKRFKNKYPNIYAISADGRALPFRDNKLFISYSNAVIEHIGTREDQLTFLKESYRIGEKGFLSTPNRHFPIEMHSRLPLLHILMPKRFIDSFLIRIGKSWAADKYMNLLSFWDLRSLIDEAGISNFRIIRNRFLGFTMTFIVVWNKNSKSDI